MGSQVMIEIGAEMGWEDKGGKMRDRGRIRI